MYNKVLVPLDGSTLSEISLTYLAALAARLETLDIEMTLLYVCHKRNGEFDPADRSYVEGKAAEVQRRLSEAQQKSDLHAGEKPVEVKGVLVEGHPAEAILSYAEDNSMDLIMMTTHGQSGLLRWAMGSVAYKVVHASNIPVWIIPSKVSKDIVEDQLPARALLVPLDGSKEGESVLPHVEAIAKQRGVDVLPVVLLQVCEPPDIIADYPEAEMELSWEEHVKDETERARAAGERYLSGVENRLKDAGLTVRSEVLLGEPADEIIGYVEKNPANVIAMTTHGRSGVSRWLLGSVAEKVLSAVPCPVLLARPH